MKRHLAAWAVYSVALVLILAERKAPLGPFGTLTVGSYLAPSTFVIVAAIAERYGQRAAIEIAVSCGVGAGVTLVALVIGRDIAWTWQIALFICAIAAAYPVGATLAGGVMLLTRRVPVLRFYLAAALGLESVRLAVFFAVAAITSHWQYAFQAFNSEMMFGAIIALIYALLGCALLWFVHRAHPPFPVEPLLGDAVP